ncbi:Uncharacterized protein LW94_4803 [Fusarium fujikuroi]|nr:Uncharacterized protein Y057_8114 [Fusarium fujikuroi]KLP22853.1 Uncharacterized protein LW94_4803 [Fusarium fujikuroi]
MLSFTRSRPYLPRLTNNLILELKIAECDSAEVKPMNGCDHSGKKAVCMYGVRSFFFVLAARLPGSGQPLRLADDSTEKWSVSRKATERALSLASEQHLSLGTAASPPGLRSFC